VRTIIFSEWFMFNPNWPIFQLYHVENMFLVDQMKVMSALYWTVTHLSSIFSAISKKQVHRKTHYTDSKPISLCSSSWMPSAKQTSNNDLFFVIVCYPFEWKHMCGGFTLVFFLLYCCRKSKYQEGKVGISFCCLSRKHACACPNPGPWFQNQSQIFIKLFMV
jgi:hypothetical protein